MSEDWMRLYHLMICRDRWVFEPMYFRSENLTVSESIGMLYTLLDNIEERFD